MMRKRAYYSMMLAGFLLATLMSVPAAAVAGGSHAFTTDRPSQSDASTLVPPGYLQMEAGYTWSEDDSAGVMTETHSAPNLVMRYGMADWFELRVGWDGYQWIETDPDLTPDGAGDGQVSAKFYLWQEAGWRPETTLLAGTTLPFGEDGISSDRIDPFFRFLLTHSLPAGFSFSSNLGVTWKTLTTASGRKDTAPDFTYTALLGYSVTPNLDGFVEFFGSVPLDDDRDRVLNSPSAEDR
ncbi:MAG: hypothetical protein GWN24_23410, partial [Nitrospinaceae bacterium]|nr:hypothetical protein [Nitrospinaceae bacterium]